MGGKNVYDVNNFLLNLEIVKEFKDILYNLDIIWYFKVL